MQLTKSSILFPCVNFRLNVYILLSPYQYYSFVPIRMTILNILRSFSVFLFSIDNNGSFSQSAINNFEAEIYLRPK